MEITYPPGMMCDVCGTYFTGTPAPEPPYLCQPCRDTWSRAEIRQRHNEIRQDRLMAITAVEYLLGGDPADYARIFREAAADTGGLTGLGHGLAWVAAMLVVDLAEAGGMTADAAATRLAKLRERAGEVR